jgi:hypothetical protein
MLLDNKKSNDACTSDQHNKKSESVITPLHTICLSSNPDQKKSIYLCVELSINLDDLGVLLIFKTGAGTSSHSHIFFSAPCVPVFIHRFVNSEVNIWRALFQVFTQNSK